MIRPLLLLNLIPLLAVMQVALMAQSLAASVVVEELVAGLELLANAWEGGILSEAPEELAAWLHIEVELVAGIFLCLPAPCCIPLLERAVLEQLAKTWEP